MSKNAHSDVPAGKHIVRTAKGGGHVTNNYPRWAVRHALETNSPDADAAMAALDAGDIVETPIASYQLRDLPKPTVKEAA